MRPYIIIVVFEGGNVTPLGLLLELHSHYTLSRIPILYTSEEVKAVVTNPVYPVALFAPMSSRMTVHVLEPHCDWTLLVQLRMHGKCMDMVATSG